MRKKILQRNEERKKYSAEHLGGKKYPAHQAARKKYLADQKSSLPKSIVAGIVIREFTVSKITMPLSEGLQ